MEFIIEETDQYIEPVIGTIYKEQSKSSVFNDQYTALDEQFIEQYDNKSNSINYPFVLPTLYANHISQMGKYLVYRIGFDGRSLVVEYGQLGGELQVYYKEIECKGRKSVYQQGYQEAKKKWSDQLKKRYRLDTTVSFDAKKNIVMLANQLKSNTAIQYPVYVQYKLDGMRFTALLDDDQDRVVIRSRVNNEFVHLNHLRTELKQLLSELPTGYIVDGELYIHGYTFQQLSSIIKSTKEIHPENCKVEAHIFDLIDTGDLQYSQRLEMLEDLLLIESPPDSGLWTDRYQYLTLVPTYTANSREEIDSIYTEALSEGYEGVMIRKMTAPYSPGRSNNILKVKPLQTDEGTIIDVVSGVGSHSDLAIFRIKDSLNIVTDVVPKGSHETRRQWLQQKDELIGRRYQIAFQERISGTNAPRNPVGIQFI